MKYLEPSKFVKTYMRVMYVCGMYNVGDPCTRRAVRGKKKDAGPPFSIY